MADKETKIEKTVEVPVELLTKMQEQMADMERKLADGEAKTAGLEQVVAKNAETAGENKLKEKKDFEPKFRTVKIKKYPIAGDIENMGYVIGWTDRGAYEDVVQTGMGPTMVNFIDLIFLGKEKNKEGKIQAEKVKLLDFMNKGIPVHCKILETKKDLNKVPTGEEIDVSIFDPAHGLISTGDKIDGYTVFSDIEYKLQIPGVTQDVWVDSVYCNA